MTLSTMITIELVLNMLDILTVKYGMYPSLLVDVLNNHHVGTVTKENASVHRCYCDLHG